MKLFNCHAEFISASHDSELPSSADKVTSFAKGSTVPFVKQIRNDKKTYLSSGREKNFNAKTCLSIRNLREGNNNNCTDALSVCKADISPKGGDGKRAAFTLAEVLITLTIIGVIAALTIPNLMQSWRKHERISQIKTAYSLVQNATKMAIAEHGSPDGWDFNSGGGYAPKYFIPYVKTQKLCGVGTASAYFKGSGCFINNGSNGIWYRLDGNKFSEGSGGGYGSSYYYTMILENGMHIGIWAPEARNQSSTYNGVEFLVDVNGKQGPSILGNDIFSFNFNPRGDKNAFVMPYGNCKAHHPSNCPTWNTSGSSTCTSSGSGQACTYTLEKNGWKFPDDYPIKKF